MSGSKRKEKWDAFHRNWYLYGVMLAVLALLGVISFLLLRTELLKNTQELGGDAGPKLFLRGEE